MREVAMYRFVLISIFVISWKQDIIAAQNACQTYDGTMDGDCRVISECPFEQARLNKGLDVAKLREPCQDAGDNKICCKVVRRNPIPPKEPKQPKGLAQQKCYEFHQNNKNCSNPYIVGGEKVNPKEFPHMALLGYKRDDNTMKWRCVGSLISSRFVLTAAHCLEGATLINYVRLGEIDYNTEADQTRVQNFNVKMPFKLHPDYYGDKYNDIGLIELDHDAVFDEFVYPACIATESDSEIYRNYARPFCAAGWGLTKTSGEPSSHLLKVDLWLFEADKCNETVDDEIFEQGIQVRTQFCVIGKENGRGYDTCQGDSGGPLFIPNPNYPCTYLIAGVVSSGMGCGIEGVPSINTRVNNFAPWIESVVWDSRVSL